MNIPPAILDRMTEADGPGRTSSGTGPGDWFVQEIVAARQAAGEVWVDHHSALTYSAFWACVRVIAQTIGALGWHVFERSPDGRSKMPVEDDIAWLLGMQSNTEVNALEFRQALVKDALTWGNGYAEIERSNSGRPMWLWRIAPDRVCLERDEAGTLYYGVRNTGGGHTYLDPANVFHLKGLSPDGLVGYSVVSMHRRAIGLGMSTEAYGASFFGKGLMPSGILTIPGSPKKEAREEVRTGFERAYGGSQNAGKVVVLWGNMEFAPFTLPNDDAQLLECTAPGTLFTMADGSRRAVETLRPGDIVTSWDGGRLVRGHVSAVCERPPKELVRLTTHRGRSLTASIDHPVLTRLAMRTPGGRYNPHDEWVHAGNLAPGNYVRIALGTPSLAEGAGQLDTQEAYVLGAMVGDGCIRASGHELGWTSGEDGVTARMAGAVGTLGGSLAVRGGKYAYGVRTGGCGRGGSRIRRLLEDSGQVGRHSHDKTVPESVVRAGPVAWRAFLSGLFDADGSVSRPGGKKPQTACLSSTSRELLDGCQHLFSLLGIQSAVYATQAGGPYSVLGVECVARPSWGLYVLGSSQLKLLAASLDLAHVEKRRRLDACLDAEASRYRQDNFDYDRVVSVERLGLGPTVGVEIFGFHNHVTAGIVTHNSRVFSAEEMAAIFGVPPHLIGRLERATFSNIEHQAISWVQNCLLPWCRRLECEADVKLFGRTNRGRRFTQLNLNTLLRGDSATQTANITAQVSSGLRTINEARQYLELNPHEDGDELLIQGAMVTVDTILNPPEPPEPPAPAPAPRPAAKPKPAAATGDVRRVFAGLLAEVYDRLLRVEADKARRAANRGELARHLAAHYTPKNNDEIAEMVRPIAEALLLAAGRPLAGDAAADWAVVMAEDHCGRSVNDMADGVKGLEGWGIVNGDPARRASAQAAEHVALVLEGGDARARPPFDYSPDQKRDSNGRFGTGGGSGADADHKVKTAGDVSPEFAAKMRAVYDGLEPKVRETIEKNGRAVIADVITTTIPEAKGETPRGWPPGYTWDHVAGVYDGNRRQAVVAEHTLDDAGNRIGGDFTHEGRAGVFRHELGHAYDAALGRETSKGVYVDAYEKDRDKVLKNKVPDMEYFLQRDALGSQAPGRQEAFAQVFAAMHGELEFGGRAKMLEHWPNVANHILGTMNP